MNNAVLRIVKASTHLSHAPARFLTANFIPFRSISTTFTMAQEFKLKDVTSLALQPGDKQEVEVEGLDAKVLLLNAGGKVQAVGPKCTHYGAPLVKGILGTNGKITCPWHGGSYHHHPASA
jgi:nitrite reductase/ring-hydroxylating ferredoxin subunit